MTTDDVIQFCKRLGTPNPATMQIFGENIANYEPIALQWLVVYACEEKIKAENEIKSWRGNLRNVQLAE